MYVQPTFPVFPVCSRSRQWSITTISWINEAVRRSCPFICTVDQQTNPRLQKHQSYLIKKKKKKGQTNINKCIRTWLNVRYRRCPNHKMFKREQKQPGVVYLLCSVSVWMLLTKGWTVCLDCITKQKKRQQFLLSGGVSFLFSNLYINCNMRSYQYSTFVSVFHLWVSNRVSGGDANIGCCCLFFTWILNLFIAHSAILT